MFKLAIYLNNENITIDPFACHILSSYIRNEVLVLTKRMLQLTNDLRLMNVNNNDIKHIIVIGDSNTKSEHSIVVIDNLNECIKLLFKNYSGKDWWFIGDNQMANDMIWKGIAMDVYVSKSYAQPGLPERTYTNQHIITQPVAFNRHLLEKPLLNFDLISSTVDTRSSSKSLRHYFRMNQEESILLSVMREIAYYGFKQSNRTGVPTRAVFGKQFEYKLVERIDPVSKQKIFRIPVLTTKRMFIRGVFEELKWFLSGGTNSKILEEKGVNIWKSNTTRQFLDNRGLSEYAEGETGPIYGFQWRHANAEYISGKEDYTGEGIDQVANLLSSLRNDPFSRRHIINAWNVADINKMCLPPCHVIYQFMVHEEDSQKYLSVSMYQRSCDTFLGLPFNICSLAILLMLVAHKVDMIPYKIVHSIGDMHIYENHIDAVMKQTMRTPFEFPHARIVCNPKENIEDYNFEDLQIYNYYSHPPIRADMVA